MSFSPKDVIDFAIEQQLAAASQDDLRREEILAGVERDGATAVAEARCSWSALRGGS